MHGFIRNFLRPLHFLIYKDKYSMKTDNEKWSGNSKRSGSDASRDGNSFEKKNVKSILKGSRGVSKSGGYSNSQSGYKKNYDSNRKSDYNDNSGDKNYGNRYPKSELPDDYGNKWRNDEKPVFRKKSSSESGEDGQRPYQKKSYTSSANRDNRSGSYGNRGGNSSYNRSSNDRYNSDGKVSFRKKEDVERGTGNFVETRFDNRKDGVVFRKPRSKDPNYDPNAKYSQKKRIAYQRETVDLTKPIRLNKFLANTGICSRREADEYITAGVISVNGEIITELGTKILPTDKVKFHDQPVQSERKVYLLLNKPKDCVTTTEDKHAKITVLDIVRNACSERIYPVGRLDRNTTGVLLLTNDGDLASRLTHPKYEKKKIYHVTLDKALAKEDFSTILEGLELDDGVIAADSLEYVKEDSDKQVGIEIHSGKNRVVRRLFDKLGYKVMRLDRVYFAGLTKKNLPRGKYRFLSEREISMLKMGAYE